MEFTKVKPMHYLMTGYTPQQKGNLVTIVCLTAHLERKPTDREVLQHMHNNAVTSLEQALNLRGTSLELVMDKVLEDCDRVNHKRGLNAKHQKTYREKHSSGKEYSKPLCKPTEKRREEKIREEYKEKYTFLGNDSFFESFAHFVAMREKIKPRPTDRAYELILGKLHKEKIETATKMLDQSVENSWKGVFPVKTKNKEITHGGSF